MSNTKEITVRNFMEALLRSSLILGDLHRSSPVRLIEICAYRMEDNRRVLYPQCTITMKKRYSTPSRLSNTDDDSDEYQVIYPAYQFYSL